jgi:hypothetical protein
MRVLEQSYALKVSGHILPAKTDRGIFWPEVFLRKTCFVSMADDLDGPGVEEALNFLFNE